MFRFIKKSFLAMVHGLRRPSRRTAPRMIELERRRLLSSQGTDKALVESVRPPAADREIHDPEDAKTSKQTRFVDGLYEKYLHEAPDQAELSYALQLLSSGVSKATLKRNFKALAAKPSHKNSDEAFVSALYSTIAGRGATAAGQAYWQGLLASGESRPQVQAMFQASGGLLPPPTIIWAPPTAITYGTALGPAQLDATASVPGTFNYVTPAGTILNAGVQTLIVSFTPSDTTDYPTVTGSTTLGVLPATPTITWATPGSIKQGTMLSGSQLDAVATCIVGGHTVTVPGTYSYSPEPGTVLPAGSNQKLIVIFIPINTTNFITVSTSTIDRGRKQWWRW